MRYHSQIIEANHVLTCASVQLVVLNVSATTSMSLPAGVAVRVILASFSLSLLPPAHVRLVCVSAVKVMALGELPAGQVPSETVTLATPDDAAARDRSRSFSVPLGSVGGMGKRSSHTESAAIEAATPSPSSCGAALGLTAPG